MSKKKVLDYDPKTGFGNFAEIMNANNAIDMAQNRVNAGMVPVTASVANPAAGVANAPMKLETPTSTPVVGDAVAVGGTVSGGETGSESVDTSVGTTAETPVSGTATETVVTARPITSTPITGGAMQSEADWYAAQGLDPDKDYENARAALEYDYETSMATYGQRAEELYQMGLSNSGVSDIYQLGAFNAYLASQNDLAYQRIEAKKKNRQAYLAYKNEYEAGVKADTANAYNFGLEQFDYEMDDAGTFTTNNAEDIRAQLLAQGYDAAIVDNVIGMLSSLNPETLPIEKAQAAERKKAQEEANAKAELKTTATRLAFNNYNGDNIGEVESMLLNTPGVDSQMAKEIIDYLKDLKPEDLAESTAYKKRQEEITAEEQAKKENSVTVTGEDGIDYTIDRDVLNSGLSILGAAELPVGAAKETVAKILGPDFSEDEINAIYARFAQIEAAGKEETERVENEQKTEESDTVVSGIQGVSDSAVSVSGMAATLNEAAAKYGKDSDEYKKIASEVSSKLKSTIDWALSENDAGIADNLFDAYTLAGMSYDEWNNPETFGVKEKDLAGAQVAHLLEVAGDAHKNGYLDDSAYVSLVDEWIGTQVEGLMEDDESNARASGLKDSGALVWQLTDFYKKGYMSEDVYNKQLDRIISDIGLVVDGAQIRWGDFGSDASVGSFYANLSTSPVNETISEKLDTYISSGGNPMKFGDHPVVGYKGKLYYKHDSGWSEFTAKNLNIVGDNVTNDDLEREGIYTILARYFDADVRMEKLKRGSSRQLKGR